MHTISSLRTALGLSTTNQVRNRIESIKDVLQPHLRRGPNNQILISDEGVEILRRLQELYDSGLTMAEASAVMRANDCKNSSRAQSVSSAMTLNRASPSESGSLVAALREEIAFLRQRVAYLETQLRSGEASTAPAARWWEALKEEIDGD